MSKHAEFMINDSNKNKTRLQKGELSKHCAFLLGGLSPFLVESENDECMGLSWHNKKFDSVDWRQEYWEVMSSERISKITNGKKERNWVFRVKETFVLNMCLRKFDIDMASTKVNQLKYYRNFGHSIFLWISNI